MSNNGLLPTSSFKQWSRPAFHGVSHVVSLQNDVSKYKTFNRTLSWMTTQGVVHEKGPCPRQCVHAPGHAPMVAQGALCAPQSPETETLLTETAVVSSTRLSATLPSLWT